MTMSRFFDSAALVCICGVRCGGEVGLGQGRSEATGLEVEFRWVYGRIGL